MTKKFSNFKKPNIFSIINDNDYSIYHDILLWYPENYFDLESKEKVEDKNSDIPKKDFKIDEIGKWLLDYNYRFRNEYEGSNIRKSSRLHDKRNMIKNAVNSLVELGLITIPKEIESDRNKNIITKEYSFTESGIIIAWLITTYKKQNTENYRNCIDIFLSNLIKSLQVWCNISIFDFIRNLLVNCIDNKAIEKFIELERYVGLFINLMYKENISSIRRSLLAIVVLNKNIYEIFIDTINNLDENKKNILLLQFKLEIESLFENAYHIPETLRNWEIMRYENICNADVITMIGNCPTCGNIPFKVNVFRSFELFWFFSEFYFQIRENTKFVFDIEILNELLNNSKVKDKGSIQKEVCPLCKNNNLKVFFRIQKDTDYDEIFIYIDKNMTSLKELANRA